MTFRLGFAAALALTPIPAAVEPAAPSILSEIDPLRLATAKVTVDAVFPPGTYARIMKTSMDSIMGPMLDKVKDMPLRDLAAMAGIGQEDIGKMAAGNVREIMAIYDPAFDRRMQITMRVMTEEMTGMMTQFEPGFRDGLARAYAKRFTVAQLSELNRFFATSTGAIYAAELMTLFTDPEVMVKMTEMIPQMMTQLPQITSKLEAASAGLPKPRKLEDLSTAERMKLAKLLDISVERLGRRGR